LETARRPPSVKLLVKLATITPQLVLEIIKPFTEDEIIIDDARGKTIRRIILENAANQTLGLLPPSDCCQAIPQGIHFTQKNAETFPIKKLIEELDGNVEELLNLAVQATGKNMTYLINQALKENLSSVVERIMGERQKAHEKFKIKLDSPLSDGLQKE